MNTVIDMNTRTVIKSVMSVEEAEAIVGEGLMIDELNSTLALCVDDAEICEACGVLIDQITSKGE